MAIKIQTRKTEIPIEIGHLKFAFDVSDDSIQKFREQALEVEKEFHSISVDEDDEKALEQAKAVLKKGFDMMLGDGAFEQIYKLSPSIMLCMDYFVQVVQGINEEVHKLGIGSPQDKRQKYLRKRK